MYRQLFSLDNIIDNQLSFYHFTINNKNKVKLSLKFEMQKNKSFEDDDGCFQEEEI